MFLFYPGGGWIGILVLIATALISWLFLRRFLFRTWVVEDKRLLGPDPNYLNELKLRYARGEITHEEYQKMREELQE